MPRIPTMIAFHMAVRLQFVVLFIKSQSSQARFAQVFIHGVDIKYSRMSPIQYRLDQIRQMPTHRSLDRQLHCNGAVGNRVAMSTTPAEAVAGPKAAMVFVRRMSICFYPLPVNEYSATEHIPNNRLHQPGPGASNWCRLHCRCIHPSS